MTSNEYTNVLFIAQCSTHLLFSRKHKGENSYLTMKQNQLLLWIFFSPDCLGSFFHIISI